MAARFEATVLQQVESEIKAIKLEYRDLIREEAIDDVADQSLRRLAGSRVPQYVPLFVGRFTRERLREMLERGQ